MEFWIQVYICVNIFIIGTLFGSFFTLATYRIPRKEDIVTKRSYCPKCNHRLNFFDLLPILSYVFLLGKCRYCHNKISIKYPLFEITNGLIFLTTYFIFGFSMSALAFLILYIYLFLNIGCYYSKKKMIEKEIYDVQNFNYKKGVFVSELVVAALILIIVLTTTFTISRNYIVKNLITNSNSNAITACVKNLEIALATDYEDLSTFTNVDEIDGITFTTVISVAKYSDEYFNKKDYIKKVKGTTSYIVNGKSYTYELSTLKKRVID